MRGDDGFLKLFCFDQELWYGDGCSPPVKLAPADLDALLRSCVCVRVLADANLAESICRLWRCRLSGRLLSLQLCSPYLCQDGSPDGTLLKMRGLLEPASCGGWHEMQEPEYVSYAICDSMRRGRHDEALEFLLQHPLWRFTSFLPCSDPLSVCGFIAAVRDPRFYINIEHRDDHCRLYSYLGLLQRPSEAGRGSADGDLSEKVPNLDTRAGRAAYTMGAWDGRRIERSVEKLSLDSWFLQLLACVNGDEGRQLAAKMFVGLAVSYWLNSLVGASVPDGLFSPEYWIADDDVVKSLRQHLRSFDSR